MKGAPIRFVATVIGGWTCLRVAMLLPDVERRELANGVLTSPAEATAMPAIAAGMAPTRAPPAVSIHAFPAVARGRRLRAASALSLGLVTREPLADRAEAPAREQSAPSVIVAPNLGSTPAAWMPRRWAASAWLLARGGAGGTLSGGRLGASQAGVRVTYGLDATRRVALAARLATPLKGRGTEAAIGVDWQPTAAPVHLVAEQRIGIDGARGGPTLMAIAGLNPRPIAAGFRLEAYAQAGAILRGGEVQAFGDGAIRATRRVATLGRTALDLDLGLGAWGAGQPGATRVDVGPTIAVALPVLQRTVRLSLDWRQRVAGQARPGSGPALSIGSDF